ncbi:MAG: hypothetical protein IPN76_22310 [Saprospiraceae bacterium]|nr:hypothetical protein [Saprospiraceae bacterium]
MENLLQTFAADWTWLHATCVAAGALIVWLLARWKSVTEIKVLKSELATRNVSLFEKMVALDEKQRQIVRNLNDSLRRMLEAAAAGDATNTRKYREEVSNAFLLDLIGSYYHYAGLGRWVYQDNKAELMDDELMPFLETSAALLRQLNDEALLKLTGSKPLQVQDFDFQFAIRYIQRHSPFWHWQRRRDLDKTVKTLFG